jgi:spermidine synthase
LAARFIAIALVSFALILFEIAVTRMLSVILWYHWAFLSVSLAMLGLGAPGVWFSLTKNPQRFLRPMLYASAILPALAIVLIFKLGALFKAYGILFCLFCLMPAYLALGGVICLLLMAAPGREISRMYGYDLLGAFLGALAVVPLMGLVATPQMAASLGFLMLAGVVILDRKVGWVVPLIGSLLVGALIWGEPFTLRYSKRYDERDRPPMYERWTPTARLTFHQNSDFTRRRGVRAGPFGWGWGANMPPVSVEQYRILQDGGAATPITQFNGDIQTHGYLLYDVTTAGYQLRPPDRVAIIGAGGGRDILTAKLSGAGHIDAIELHEEIIQEVSGRYADFSGDVYGLPGVNAIAGDGRNALTRLDSVYDLIQISMIDSWAATAAGAFALSENNLYTVEAYQLYWSRLAPDGIVSTSRWIAGAESAELPRLILMIREVLIREGVSSPERHLAVIQGGRVATVLLSKSPLEQLDVARLAQTAERRGFQLHYPQPGGGFSGPVGSLLADGKPPAALSGFDLKPPVDDRPFYFQVLDPFRFIDGDRVEKLGVNAQAVYALQILMITMVIATSVLFFLPLVLRRWLAPAAGFWQGSGYFAVIGIGFMLVEIPWLQRFILYLGHPSHATTVTLASLLLGAGIGSMLSSRFSPKHLASWGFAVPLLIALVNQSLSPLFDASLGWSYLARVAVSGTVLIPVGVAMGFFFPLGMIRFGDRNKAWFWAVNGATGVLASVFSLALSMKFGFTAVTLAGSVLYLVAVVLLRGTAEKDKTKEVAERTGEALAA